MDWADAQDDLSLLGTRVILFSCVLLDYSLNFTPLARKFAFSDWLYFLSICCVFLYTVKMLKIWTPENFGVITQKVKQDGFIIK